MGGSLSIRRQPQSRLEGTGLRTHADAHATSISGFNETERVPFGLDNLDGILRSLCQRTLDEIVRDAHNAEGRREKKFRDNEDARQRVFLANEESRNAESRHPVVKEGIANVPITLVQSLNTNRGPPVVNTFTEQVVEALPYRTPSPAQPFPPGTHPSHSSPNFLLEITHTPPEDRHPSSEPDPHGRWASCGMDDGPGRYRHQLLSATAMGDNRRSPQLVTSNSANPSRMIAAMDEKRALNETMIHHIPPQRPQLPSGLDGFDDASHERQRQLGGAGQASVRIAHDARNAESRHETELRVPEDTRARIFVDDGERREIEMGQRGGTLIHAPEPKFIIIPPVLYPPSSPDLDHASIIESLVDETSYRPAVTQYSSKVFDTVRLEREERARLDEARRLLDEERESKITALEDQLARTRAELDSERNLRTTEANELRRATAERDEVLRNQLAGLTNMVQQNMALMGTITRLMGEQAAARQREEEHRQANEGKVGIEEVMGELQRQNAEQRDLLDALSEGWRADSNRQHQETIDAIRATAQEQVPYNVQGYLDEFSRAAAAEVRILLGEIGKLRVERGNLQQWSNEVS